MKPLHSLLILVGLLCIAIYCSEPRPSPSNNPPSIGQLLQRLIDDHPDKAFTKALLSEIRQGDLSVLPVTMTRGGTGRLDWWERFIVKREFGFNTKHNPQPVILLSVDLLVSSDARDRVTLMKTLHHEFGHYRQWQTDPAAFFPEEQDGELICQAMLRREIPLYREDCAYVRRWWGHDYPMNTPMQMRCDAVGDSELFERIVRMQLGQNGAPCTH